MSENIMTVCEEDMRLINGFSRRELSADEVYVFPLVLCDNEIDRDCERFSIKTLETLAELFVGKTGIFDHDAKGKNQTARIFTTEVVTDSSRMTRAGEPYTCISAKAYIMRTDSNSDLIKEIEGGIKKEVSVSCSIKRRICSICGNDKNKSVCSHAKGSYYSGKLCSDILTDAADAYEWSFVAVPAQPNAGITKSLGAASENEQILQLKRDIDLREAEISKAKRELTASITRLGQFCVPAYDPQTIGEICSKMSISELLAFKKRTQKLAKPERPVSVLSTAYSDDETKERRAKSPFALGKKN